MGKKKKAAPAQEPVKVIQPFEHDWTEPQICTLLTRIAPDETYQQLFFMKHNKHNSKMVMQEQKLALALLPNTDWMKYMIKEKRVVKTPEGELKTTEEWPKKMRVISKLFDVIHTLADDIKVLLGSSSTSAELKKDNPEGYRLWRDWQKSDEYTWYFSYVAIKNRLFPRLSKDKPSTTSITQLELPKISIDTIASSNSQKSGESIVKSSTSTITTPKPPPSSPPSRSISPFPRSPSRSQHDHLSPYFTGQSEKQSQREVPPHLQKVKPKLAESLHEFIGSLKLDDIPLEPPSEVWKDGDLYPTPATTPQPFEGDDGLSRQETVRMDLRSGMEVGYGDNEELVSAMMMLMIQELNEKRSNCMDKVAIAYEPPLNLSERAVLCLVIKMGGRLISLCDKEKMKEFYRGIVGLEDESAYILWKDTNNFAMMVDVSEANRDTLPIPISLVGVVQMMVGNRKREMERGMVDLVTF
ncbi:hypothetical protein L486_08074 [Kwoniella mangroviensis CBS 10435]|uniref:Uncharacterized protein n=1 Tax=Kwoniella mangroviensis CBS 10435 TaxID=1331196 RepID=A0A1B9IGK2_9TREE|nr:hypothetical protein L486_08074 [Kwoniella mangroviensis CBS 10435]